MMAVHSREYCIKAVLTALADGRPRSAKEIVSTTSIDEKAISHLLSNLWRKHLILRTDKPLFEYIKQFKGRAGFKSNTRMFHLYIINDQTAQGEEQREGKQTSGETTNNNPIFLDGHTFVQFSPEYSDKRGNRGSKSKAQLILNFLKENSDRAFYSTEIFNALKEKGVTMPDIMTTARRYERKGLLYVRGYQTHDSQSPFQEGYLITWIEQGGNDLNALKQAVMRTNEALKDNASTNPLVQRVLAIRNLVVSETELGRITSVNQIKDMLKAATDTEAESAIMRAMQLYPSIREVKLFNAYRYYYHESMNAEVLTASLEMAKNYIRISKGRANRIGHNWEACVEWFIDRFTIGAEFRTQNHRQNGKGGGRRMDPRRITLQRLQTETDPAVIASLENEIKALEQLNMKLYEIEPQLEKRLYAAEKLLMDKYTDVNSTSYVGDNPVDTVFADVLTRSIVLFVNPDKVVPGGSNLPTETAIDSFPVRVEYGKTEDISCVNNSRTEECRPLIGGISIREQSKIGTTPFDTLGYKATYNGNIGFVLAGHSAVANLKYIIQPYDENKVVGQVQRICWSDIDGCDGDFAWARAATGISVYDDICMGQTACSGAYDISSKRADSGQTLGTFVIKSGAASGNTLGEVNGNSPNSNYNTAKIPVTFGDSGSPIFWESGSNADLFGVITAKLGADYAKYWPQDYVETKIGAVAQTT